MIHVRLNAIFVIPIASNNPTYETFISPILLPVFILYIQDMLIEGVGEGHFACTIQRPVQILGCGIGPLDVLGGKRWMNPRLH